jgi:uncharacterized SAM-binding protein YcdF (DUF218 family)
MTLDELKPLLSFLVMPLTLGLIVAGSGWALSLRARRSAWRSVGIVVTVVGAGIVWAASLQVSAVWLQDHVLVPPRALASTDIDALRAQGRRDKPGSSAIVVLGGGRKGLADEYGTSMLTELPMARLHYGVWLARATGLPLAYSGGVGWAQTDGASEADTAQQVATRDYRLPMRWIENQSRDTRENARLTVATLRQAGVRHIIVVTHASHMRRSLRAFRDAAGSEIEMTAAPMGFATLEDKWPLPWLPSAHGSAQVHAAWHEVIGLLLNR